MTATKRAKNIDICREFKSKITIVDTISWGNGVNRWNFPDFGGDGNGFKLGGGDAADIGVRYSRLSMHHSIRTNLIWNI